jgi:hypothetical protein
MNQRAGAPLVPVMQKPCAAFFLDYRPVSSICNLRSAAMICCRGRVARGMLFRRCARRWSDGLLRCVRGKFGCGSPQPRLLTTVPWRPVRQREDPAAPAGSLPPVDEELLGSSGQLNDPRNALVQ